MRIRRHLAISLLAILALSAFIILFLDVRTARAPHTTSTPILRIGSTVVRETDDAVMVYVPAGEFLMGSTEDDPEAEDDEKPQHTVYVGSFWIDRTEVSVAQFRRFVRETGYETEAEREGIGHAWTGTAVEPVQGASWQHPQGPGSDAQDDHPVVLVSWNDASAYCAWAGTRLPTEAEWEKAARGTGGYIYPWGNAFEGHKANFCDRNCAFDDWKDPDIDDGYALTAPVASYPAGASPYGALGMAGNIWEWVADWYSADYYAGAPARNPQGPDSGELRVLRGGSWYDSRGGVSAASRGWGAPEGRGVLNGFRCAMSCPFSP